MKLECLSRSRHQLMSDRESILATNTIKATHISATVWLIVICTSFVSRCAIGLNQKKKNNSGAYVNYGFSDHNDA
jgi:hypothetical protein